MFDDDYEEDTFDDGKIFNVFLYLTFAFSV